ncbi:MAG: transcription termination/antitermination NusG family protein [Pseudomonadota bacterium]
MTWRLLYVRSGREFAVLAELKERHLDGYVPAETVWRGPPHRRVPHKRPLLVAGYVFADLADVGYAVARGLPDVTGALRIVCQAPEQTRELDERIGAEIGRFIEPIRAREAAGEFDHTRRRGEGFSVGQAVKIVKGLWRGHLATITALRGRHKVQVDIARMGPMEIDAAKLEDAAT